MPRKTVEERFWEKVAKGGPDDCWPFTGARSPKGYGVLNRSSHGEGFAHRRALGLSGVEVPPQLCVLHSCDNPACCNPAHLSLGDRAENNRQMVERGRRASFAGSHNNNAKLTAEDVRAIRRLAAGGAAKRSLGRQFGISEVQVGRIVRGERWREIPAEQIEAWIKPPDPQGRRRRK